MEEFPGSGFEADERNLAALKYLDELFAYSRIKPSGCLLRLCLLLYYPLGAILIFIRLFLFIPLTGMVAAVTCTSFCLPRWLHTFILRLEFLVFFGVCVKTKGKPEPGANVWVANHISEFDAPALRTLADPFIVGYSFYTAMWWLKCSPLNVMKMIYVDPKSRTEGNGVARNEINERIKDIVVDRKELFLIFPEGGLTCTEVGLMQYHKFVFSLGAKVQPIALRIESPLPVYVDGAYVSFFSNVLYFFFMPFQRYVVEFLPAVELDISSGETALDFARRVTKMTAQALNMKVSPFLYSDKKKWLKLKKSLEEEGYVYTFRLNKENRTVAVENVYGKKNASCNSSAAVVAPLEFTSNTDRDHLIAKMKETWGMEAPEFTHLVFSNSSTA